MQWKYIKTATSDGLLLLIRCWLGYRLIGASYSSVVGILTSPKERLFFEQWFGRDLHIPMPVLMAFFAKGIELAGGTLLIVGFFTRQAALLVAFTMIVATLVANLGENFIIDGGFTISYTLFAFVLLHWGAGRLSFDYLFFQLKNKLNGQNLG